MRTPRPLLALIALSGLACGGDTLAPVDGVLEVVLSSTTATPGAIVFLVQGAAVDSIEGVGYYTASAPSGTATRVLIAGDRLSGRLALVHVPDAATSYQVVVQEAANRANFALLAPPEVRLELRRVYR